jgi:hypothetical protein
MSDGDGAAADLAPYAALLRIAERGLALAKERRYPEIAQLAAQRSQIIRGLPAKPPQEARELLTRALTMQRRLTTEMIGRREQVLLSLRRVELSKRAARGYGNAVGARRAERVQAKA